MFGGISLIGRLSSKLNVVLFRNEYHMIFQMRLYAHTVEPRFNEPLYNEVLGITNDILQPGQSYSNMKGTDPRFNEPRCNEAVLVITNTIGKPKRKSYLYVTNKCHHATKDECETVEQP